MSESGFGKMRPSRRQFLQGGLGLAAAGALAACGGGSGGGSGGSGGGPGTAVYVNKGMDFFFFVALNEAVKRASEGLGYEYQTSDAKQDAQQQYNNMNSALLQRPAFIVINTVDSDGLGPLTERAASQDIPVGAVDSGQTSGVCPFQIAFDNKRGGEMAAEKIIELLGAKYGSPRGKVLNGYGALSSVAWRLRKEGFDEVMAKYPAIEVISRPTEGAETTARAIASSTLSEFPDLDAAHAPSDSITRGIITSLANAGKAKPIGDPGHVILISIDGEPQSLQWARDGLLDAEVSQDPVAYAQVCVQMLHDYSVKGQEIPTEPYTSDKYVWGTAPIEMTDVGASCIIPPYFIDNTNADDPRQWGNVVTQQWGMRQE